MPWKKKRKRKQKLVVSYNEDEREEYLTGFHKRKVKRREKAIEEARQRERKLKLEERKERRKQEKLRIEEARKVHGTAQIDFDSSEDEAETEKKVYSDDFTKKTFGQEQVTVTTTFGFGDSESDISEDEDLEPGVRAGRLKSSGPVAPATSEQVVQKKKMPVKKSNRKGRGRKTHGMAGSMSKHSKRGQRRGGRGRNKRDRRKR